VENMPGIVMDGSIGCLSQYGNSVVRALWRRS